MIPFLALALAAPVIATAPDAVPTWTESDALAAFDRGSPALFAARAAEEQARGDLTQAGLLPNPTLGLSASNLPIRANLTGTGNGDGLARNLVTGIDLGQPIELGGKRGKRVAAARGALAEAGLGRGDARRTARYELRRAFWHAVRGRSRRELAERVARRVGDTVRISRARYAANDVSKLDLEKVELEALKIENDLADARAEERAGTADLLALVGADAPREIRVEGALALVALPVDPPRLAARAREERPDVRAARQHVETTRAQLALARAQAIPDVTAGVAWSHSRAIAAGDNPDSAALTLSIPLPVFNRNQGEVAKASSALAHAERDAAALESRISSEVQSASARYAAALEKAARYEAEILTRADRALEVAERSWRAGDASLFQFLEAERTYIALRGDHLDTLFELREAALQLERATGLAELKEAS